MDAGRGGPAVRDHGVRPWAWQVAGVAGARHGVGPDGTGCRVWMSAPGWAAAYLLVLAVALRRIAAMATGCDSAFLGADRAA